MNLCVRIKNIFISRIARICVKIPLNLQKLLKVNQKEKKNKEEMKQCYIIFPIALRNDEHPNSKCISIHMHVNINEWMTERMMTLQTYNMKYVHFWKKKKIKWMEFSLIFVYILYFLLLFINTYTLVSFYRFAYCRDIIIFFSVWDQNYYLTAEPTTALSLF